jgi:uncharacterized protein (TIGR01244 family)
MSLPLTYIAADFATSAQLAPEQMAEVAAAGFRSVVNNRPDFEGGAQQPSDRALRPAAEAAGLTYAFFPVVSGNITMDEVAQFASLLDELPRPIVAFCRSGGRSASLYRAALQVRPGRPSDAAEAAPRAGRLR